MTLPKGRLINDIVPDDELTKRHPKFYSSGSEFEITPLGYYIPHGNPLAGWIYKNIKTRQINTELKVGIDFQLI